MAPILEIFEYTTKKTTIVHIPGSIAIEDHPGLTTAIPSIPLPEHEGDTVTVRPDEEGSVSVNNCKVPGTTLEYNPPEQYNPDKSKNAILSQL